VYKIIGDINKKWQPKQRAIRDSNGKLLVNTTDIIQRWTTYCSKLYMAQHDQKVSKDLVKKLKNISLLLVDSQVDILGEKVKKAVKKLKNNKSPGNDEITGKIIKHGGPHMIEEIHQLCKSVKDGYRAYRKEKVSSSSVT